MSTSAELSPSQSHNRRPRPLLRSIVEAEVVGQGANTAGLALLVWGVASQTSDSRHATHFAAYLLLAVASAGWVSWFALRTTSHTRLALAGALVMAAAGSAIVPYASLALVFMAVPALGAGANLTPKPGAAVLVAAWVALTTSVVVLGGSTAALGDGLAASMAGLAMGMARRQSLERARAAAAMEAA
ncbi:MAG TPA: hypothetical protein VME46_24650, partial [Acidimicrobiales bacterium]|nr:hypothetical protein [Acidimicrobiales bacterium]